jgi:hypothetical protein
MAQASASRDGSAVAIGERDMGLAPEHKERGKASREIRLVVQESSGGPRAPNPCASRASRGGAVVDSNDGGDAAGGSNSSVANTTGTALASNGQ